jgi:hypothetical protein
MLKKPLSPPSSSSSIPALTTKSIEDAEVFLRPLLRLLAAKLSKAPASLSSHFLPFDVQRRKFDVLQESSKGSARALACRFRRPRRKQTPIHPHPSHRKLRPLRASAVPSSNQKSKIPPFILPAPRSLRDLCASAVIFAPLRAAVPSPIQNHPQKSLPRFQTKHLLSADRQRARLVA